MDAAGLPAAHPVGEASQRPVSAGVGRAAWLPCLHAGWQWLAANAGSLLCSSAGRAARWRTALSPTPLLVMPLPSRSLDWNRDNRKQALVEAAKAVGVVVYARRANLLA